MIKKIMAVAILGAIAGATQAQSTSTSVEQLQQALAQALKAAADAQKAAAQAQDFASSDFDISCLTFRAAEWLVDQHRGVGEAEALTRSTSGQQHRSHAHCHTYADGRDIRLEPLHGIVDGQARVDYAAG